MPSVHGNWYKFMEDKFIPSISSNHIFGNIRFTRLLSEQVEKHFTYSLQIDCADMSVYQNFMSEILPEYSEFTTSMFDVEVVHFVSLLKLIEDLKK